MNTETFIPTVDPVVWQRYPQYRALSVVVRGFQPSADTAPAAHPLRPAAWMADHLQSWREAFRAFGANPKKTPCSVEALWKRVEKNGSLPAIDPVVDLYNSLSIRFGACFGGEDIDRYAGMPRLVVARGGETFDTARDGLAVVEHPEAGEIVWRDDHGVTCRRWNWRQCKRTAITPQSRNLWFLIDRLPPMPVEALMRAGDDLISGLASMSPALAHSIRLLEPSGEPCA